MADKISDDEFELHNTCQCSRCNEHRENIGMIAPKMSEKAEPRQQKLTPVRRLEPRVVDMAGSIGMQEAESGRYVRYDDWLKAIIEQRPAEKMCLTHQPQMTLLDYFAGQAMPKITDRFYSDPQVAASKCYEAAKAMMVEREKYL